MRHVEVRVFSQVIQIPFFVFLTSHADSHVRANALLEGSMTCGGEGNMGDKELSQHFQI